MRLPTFLLALTFVLFVSYSLAPKASGVNHDPVFQGALEKLKALQGFAEDFLNGHVAPTFGSGSLDPAELAKVDEAKNRLTATLDEIKRMNLQDAGTALEDATKKALDPLYDRTPLAGDDPLNPRVTRGQFYFVTVLTAVIVLVIVLLHPTWSRVLAICTVSALFTWIYRNLTNSLEETYNERKYELTAIFTVNSFLLVCFHRIYTFFTEKKPAPAGRTNTKGQTVTKGRTATTKAVPIRRAIPAADATVAATNNGIATNGTVTNGTAVPVFEMQTAVPVLEMKTADKGSAMTFAMPLASLACGLFAAFFL